jgi:hypothetical protein
MVTPLLFLALALAQGAPAQSTLAARGEAFAPAPLFSPADSVRALRSARRARERFELVRRQNLPRELGVGSHRCDVRIGRWCVWNDESNDRKPPPESPRIRQAREKLLAQLNTAGERFPGDEWIASQQVRYLLEAKRYEDAIRVSTRCAASGSRHFCRALEGLAYHDSGAVAAADSAFSEALSAMPDSVRCRWTDIAQLLDDDVADRYAHADCAARQAIAAEFWNLTTPLYLRDHDWRNEFLARVTQAELEKDARGPSGSTSESAFRETAIRYGFDTWFVRDDPPAGSMQEAPIAGYREGGAGFNFVPDAAVFASPASLDADDWDLRLRAARTNYAPAYARHFQSLARHQLALFRRGDSALVVALYDVGGDTLFARRGLEAGLFTAAVDSTTIAEPHGFTTRDAESRGALMTTAPWTPIIVSLELLDANKRSAARARYGIRPPTRSGRVAISDLLLFSPEAADSLPHRLDDALRNALHTDRVGSGKRVGLFWETYGVRPDGESFAVTITIERTREGWMRRTAERLHLATPFSPMQVRWNEVPDREHGIASQAVSLDLSRLQAGRYEISLTVTPADGAPVVSTREVTVAR